MAVERNYSIRFARWVSIILHPYVILIPAIVFTAYYVLDEPIERLIWTVCTLVPAFVATSIYAKIRAVMVAPAGSKTTRSLIRDDPVQLLVITVLFAVPPTLILYFFSGPQEVFWIMVSLGLAMLIVSLVNTVFRASFHLAMVTSIFASLGFLFGTILLVTIPLIAILAYSRFRLGAHTPSQMVTGFIIGITASLISFYWLSNLM